MYALGHLALMIMVIAAQLPELRRLWLEDRAGSIKAWRLLGYYFLYIAVGVVILITPIRNGGAPAYVAVAGVAFILG